MDGLIGLVVSVACVVIFTTTILVVVAIDGVCVLAAKSRDRRLK